MAGQNRLRNAGIHVINTYSRFVETFKLKMVTGELVASGELKKSFLNEEAVREMGA